jgi:hypothetical protein
MIKKVILSVVIVLLIIFMTWAYHSKLQYATEFKYVPLEMLYAITGSMVGSSIIFVTFQ